MRHLSQWNSMLIGKGRQQVFLFRLVHICLIWFKKYPSMDLRGLFQYLVNQLKKGTGIELVLLQEECEDLRYRMKEGHLKRMEDNCFCSHHCRDRKEQIKDLKPLKQGMPNKDEAEEDGANVDLDSRSGSETHKC